MITPEVYATVTANTAFHQQLAQAMVPGLLEAIAEGQYLNNPTPSRFANPPTRP